MAVWSVGAVGSRVSRGVRRSTAERAADADGLVAARTAGATLESRASPQKGDLLARRRNRIVGTSKRDERPLPEPSPLRRGIL